MRTSRVWRPDSQPHPAAKGPNTPGSRPSGHSSSDWEYEPIGPDDLTIRTPHGTVAEPESWLTLVHTTLRGPGDFLIVANGPPDLYAQALNDEGCLVLEYRDGAPDRHFQTIGVGLGDVARALSEWFRGERAFIAEHTWERLSL
jgi:hypothetical protein